MEPTKLVRMVNQIAANWDHGPDQAKAVAGVADHLRRFWSPPMFDEVTRYIATGDADLSPVAERALKQLIEERQTAE